MIELYHAKHSRSMRTLWLLEELNLDFKIHETDFKELIQMKHHTEAYLKLHPQGLVPLIIDGDVTLFESGAIALYLTSKYDKSDNVSPNKNNTPLHAQYLQWLFWACCTFEPPVWSLIKHTVLLPTDKRNLTTIKSSTKKYHDVLRVLDAILAKQQYIVSDSFSAADTIIGATLEWYPRILKNYENITRYRNDYRERDAFKRAYQIERPA